MPSPRSSIHAPEKIVPIPAEHGDMVYSRGPCLVAVLRMTGLRPTRQRVALVHLLTRLHRMYVPKRFLKGPPKPRSPSRYIFSEPLPTLGGYERAVPKNSPPAA